MVQETARFERGPYLSAVVLCEKVLEERDGTKSAIRMIDRITRIVAVPVPPREMEPFDYEMALLVRFKSGWARGSMALSISIVKPSTETMATINNTLVFEGEEDRGVDVVGNMRLRFDQTGIHWINVNLEGGLLTRLPFRVVYIPQVMQIPGQSGSR